MIRGATKRQKFGWVLFIAYLILLTYFLFFAEAFGRSQLRETYAYNLVPLKEISRFIIYRDKLGMEALLLNIVGNVVAFMPLGFFLPIISRRSRRWYNTVLLSFFFSLSMETIQLALKVGSFDVDDLLLNTLGSIAGFIIYRLVQNFRVKRRKREAKNILH